MPRLCELVGKGSSFNSIPKKRSQREQTAQLARDGAFGIKRTNHEVEEESGDSKLKQGRMLTRMYEQAANTSTCVS